MQNRGRKYKTSINSTYFFCVISLKYRLVPILFREGGVFFESEKINIRFF
jgi:hypothetical protein